MFMSVDSAFHSPRALLRLQVEAEADPGALSRVLEQFQNINVLPRRVIAELDMDGVLHIQLDVLGINEERLSRIAATLGQVTTVLAAFWHYV
jgi:hypothetical protein